MNPWRHFATILLTYESRVEGADAVEEVDPPTSLDALVEVQYEGDNIALMTTVSLTQWTRSQTKIAFTGAELGAKLTVTRRENASSEAEYGLASIHVTPRLETVSAVAARQTLKLLKLMSRVGASVRFTVGGKPLNGKLNNPPPFELDSVMALVEDLVTINNAMRTDLRVPGTVDDDYLEVVGLISAAIRLGRVPQNDWRLSFTTAIDDGSKWLREVEKETLTLSMTMVFKIGEARLDLGPVSVEMKGPRIIERKITGSGSDEKMALTLTADETVFVFERWISSVASEPTGKR